MDVWVLGKNLFTAPDGSRKRLRIFRAKGMIYEGVPEPPKGKLPDDWETPQADSLQIHRAWRTMLTVR